MFHLHTIVGVTLIALTGIIGVTQANSAAWVIPVAVGIIGIVSMIFHWLKD